MPIILNPSNCEHWQLLEQWQEAADTHNALIDWRDANPRPDTWSLPFGDPGWDAYGEWRAARKAEEQRLGLCVDGGSDAYRQGRISTHQLYGSHVCFVRRLTRDSNDQPMHGDRVIQCPTCGTLFATFNPNDHHCTDACRNSSQAQRSEAKAERRRDRQTKRAESRANRTGICLACGQEFTLQRITAKTCGETCRKRLQRHPELAEQHLHLPPIRLDLAELESELNHLEHESLAKMVAAISSGQRREEDPESNRRSLEVKQTLWMQRNYQRLHAMADQAPALTAWLCQQPESTQQAAFSPEYSGLILGPNLRARLGINGCTDADVSWSIKYGQPS